MCCRDTPCIPFPLHHSWTLHSLLRTEGHSRIFAMLTWASVRDKLHLDACSLAFPWASQIGRSSDYHWSPAWPSFTSCQMVPLHHPSYIWDVPWSASFHLFTTHPSMSTTVSHSLLFCLYRSLLLLGFHQSQSQRVVFRSFHFLCLSGLFLFFCSFLVTWKDERRKNMIE